MPPGRYAPAYVPPAEAGPPPQPDYIPESSASYQYAPPPPPPPVDPAYVPGTGGYATGNAPPVPSPGLGTGALYPPVRTLNPDAAHRTAPPVSGDVNMPGPPTNYVPGSTYALPHSWVRETWGVHPYLTPGTAAYHPENRSRMLPPLQAGLGGNPAVPKGLHNASMYNPDLRIPPPLTPGLGAGGAPERPYAPYDPNSWMTKDPAQPQDYIPGSTYAPDYMGQPPIGDVRRNWLARSPSNTMGGPPDPGERRMAPLGYAPIVETYHPASGAPPTQRRIPGANDVYNAGVEIPLRDRVIPPFFNNRMDVLAEMEWERIRRLQDNRSRAERLRGLYGGG